MMSRLTELIDIDGMKIKTSKERPLSNQGLGKILWKLYYFEDLEDELGCPLDVVFKTIKNGVDGYKELVLEYDEKDGWYFDAIWKYNDFGSHHADILPLKDYGKTWWTKGDKNK